MQRQSSPAKFKKRGSLNLKQILSRESVTHKSPQAGALTKQKNEGRDRLWVFLETPFLCGLGCKM